jgi:hypothetical protein
MFDEILNTFIQKAPITVMVRALLENLLNPNKIDQWFESILTTQYTKNILFSSIVGLMFTVVCKVRPNIHSAYRDSEIAASIVAVYDKIKHVEPTTSQALVRHIAAQSETIIRTMNGTNPPLLPGFRIKYFDGNTIEATEHRLDVLRETKAAPLPGKGLIVFEQELGIVSDVFPCEDGHAQERLLLPDVFDTIKPNDLWIEDRNFCVLKFLFEIHNRSAFFIVRQHGNTPFKPLTELKFIGRCDTGKVFEQDVEIVNSDGQKLQIRRIVVELDKPNRKGDSKINIFTNLPNEAANGIVVADLYRTRWKVETALQKLEAYLNSEINTLAYPKAALFGYCLALIGFNIYAIIMAALRATNKGVNVNDTVSEYYIAQEIAVNTSGMLIIVDPIHWATIAQWSIIDLAKFLLYAASFVNLKKYKKSKRSPKKPPLKKTKFVGHPHVSTKKLLDEKRRIDKERRSRKAA